VERCGRRLRLSIIPLLLAVLAASCSNGPAVPEPVHGESILDRVVRLEPELVTAVPEAPRWCDLIPGLDKRKIDVGDASLYVELEGRGTPLVLINGGPGGTHHYFHPWFSRAAKFARIVYYDQRGCGLSDFKPGEAGYSVDQAVADLDALRTALGFDRWVLLGYSYGGYLAQLYALLHPDRVSGLILLGASPGTEADAGPSRQSEFISEAEKARMDEVRRQLGEYAKAAILDRQKTIGLSIYNSFLNGDWKRQHFYRPSPERLAQIARYEWVQDTNFNSIMGQTQARWDFTGAFEGNPIPTLILEGRWDLTWSEKKKDILLDNHPGARMVVFEKAAHGVYDEQPDEFFRVLKDFLRRLPAVDEAALGRYRAFLESWTERMKARPRIVIDRLSWGASASREIAARYSPEWLAGLNGRTGFLRTGFALYDVERYADAQTVFERMEEVLGTNPESKALALIWQGHMLDLMGKRSDALNRYRRAAEMNIVETWTHSQYGMKYALSPYARERLRTPFRRLENRTLD
jgi:proline iminopeptidase